LSATTRLLVSVDPPTRMEGLTYPILFSDPAVVLRIARAAEQPGYLSPRGERPRDCPN
jgi:hypothetical protein